MKRVKWLWPLVMLASSGAGAQTVGVTVGLTQQNVVFDVDGQGYTSTQTFLWPAGSKHILQFPFSLDQSGDPLSYQATNGGQFRWSFGGWTDNLGLLSAGGPVVTITATAGLTSIIGSVTEAMEFTLVFPAGTGSGGTASACGGAPNAPAPNPSTPIDPILGWGIVYVNGACYSDTTTIFISPGTVTLSGFPYPGYAFVGWQGGGNPPNPFLYTINVTQPAAVYAIFTPAKRVSFRTNPAGLAVTVDSATIATPVNPPVQNEMYLNSSSTCMPSTANIPPATTTYFGAILCQGDFDFVPGSSHKLGAPPAQQDPSGAWWVFTQYNDGLGQNGIYVADSATNAPDLLTAGFTPGVQSEVASNPPNLPLVVDGVTVPKSYTFVWAQGSTHTVSAPATTVDASGRSWQFVSWSNGGAGTQTVTAPSSTGMILTANYTELGQVQVTSNPPGLTFQVGSSTCTTPCAVSQVSGTQVQITAPGSVPQSATSRLDFGTWSTGASAPTLTATLTQGVQTFTANYYTSYLLMAASSPANQATFKTAPASADGFFPAGTQVSITPVPNSGYKFTGWAGDLTGTLTPGYLTMNVPHNVIAFVSGAPAIPPAGIINAAGPTPDGSVAPGSMISIYGQNLAATLEIGPTNPLAQTLANVTVTVNKILMPLEFVSPGQINAQVPVELADGSYTLTVQAEGQAPVSGTFTVKRNAPGIYTMPNAQNLPLGAALHQDGSLITMDSPARRNEIVSFYGTGFGPLAQPVIDGFPAALAPLDPVTDPVTLNAGGVTVPAVWAGAAPTLVGADIVQLQITDAIPSATTINVQVIAGGSASSIVQLPVE